MDTSTHAITDGRADAITRAIANTAGVVAWSAAPWDGVHAIAARRAMVAVDPVAAVPPPTDRSHARGIELVNRGQRLDVHRHGEPVLIGGGGGRFVIGRGCFGFWDGGVVAELAHGDTRASMGCGMA